VVDVIDLSDVLAQLQEIAITAKKSAGYPSSFPWSGCAS
jgi:hypothetical protein